MFDEASPFHHLIDSSITEEPWWYIYDETTDTNYKHQPMQDKLTIQNDIGLVYQTDDVYFDKWYSVPVTVTHFYTSVQAETEEELPYYFVDTAADGSGSTTDESTSGITGVCNDIFGGFICDVHSDDGMCKDSYGLVPCTLDDFGTTCYDGLTILCSVVSVDSSYDGYSSGGTEEDVMGT